MIISIIRVVSVLQLNIEDLTWTGVPVSLWTLAETSVAIVVACSPVCQPLFSKVRLKRLLTVFNTRWTQIYQNRKSQDSLPTGQQELISAKYSSLS